MRLLNGYKKLGYIVFMDNFYMGPDLFYILLIDGKTAACRTMQPRKGASKEITAAKFKQWGEYKVVSYNLKIIGMRLLDLKHVTLLSTAYGSRYVNTGRKHWQKRNQYPNQKRFMFIISSWVP